MKTIKRRVGEAAALLLPMLAPISAPAEQAPAEWFAEAEAVEACRDVPGRVRKIVAEHLGVDAKKVVPEADFIADLGADSLDTVELVMAFEEEFAVEISDASAEHIRTVGDAERHLAEQCKTRG